MNTIQLNIIINILIFFAGLLIGHRLEIWRDKRKEYNEIAQRLKGNLVNARNNPSPNYQLLSEIDIDLFLQYLPFWKRKSFIKAINNYKKSQEENLTRDSYGGLTFIDKHEIKARIDSIIRFFKFR